MPQSSRDLVRRMLLGFAALAVMLGVCIFVPAGSLAYWEGWLYSCVFVLCAALITLYLWRRDLRLLERRLRAGPLAESEVSQRVIQGFASAAFAAILVLCALDHRLGWSQIVVIVVLLGDCLVALGYLGIFLVFRENTFAAATVQVETEQEVITTGPYALVRHPMYSAALVMLLGTPLALGSWWGLLMLVPFAGIIIWRLLDEEKLLITQLKGYAEYRQRVRYRLIPLVW
jgi:protein-S-isoprenylcysteine O-methyltransferase Ste14